MSGYLNNGRWQPGWYDTRATGGEFIRADDANTAPAPDILAAAAAMRYS